MEMNNKRFAFDGLAVASILANEPLKAVDVGARGGFTKDLLPIASSVDGIGVEPDPDECQRLNQQAAQDRNHWRSLRYIPVALGRSFRSRPFYVYQSPGCSLLLQANQPLARNFARDEYFKLIRQLNISTKALDEAAREYNFTDAVYLKIDVQGAELEIFESGPRLMSQLIAVRTEVSFFPMCQLAARIGRGYFEINKSPFETKSPTVSTSSLTFPQV